MVKTLYTDAGYRFQDTDLHPDHVIGRICVADTEGFEQVEMVKIGKVPVLKQYINLLELIAIARAIEIAIEKGWVGSLAIHTDSQVAMIWASSGKVSKKVETVAHTSALEYLKKIRRNYIGIVTYNQVPRDYNPAGKRLEKELEKDRKARKEQPNQPEAISRESVTLDPLADVSV